MITAALIQQATIDCDRQDCCLSESGSSGAETLISWTPKYNKSGERIDSGNPNTRYTNLKCSTCKALWRVTKKYNETTLTKV